VLRLVKWAIRMQYLRLACVLAVAWDTQLSPIDVRKLTPAKLRADGDFHLDRAKDVPPGHRNALSAHAAAIAGLLRQPWL
jgi:hypothetical protein